MPSIILSLSSVCILGSDYLSLSSISFPMQIISLFLVLCWISLCTFCFLLLLNSYSRRVQLNACGIELFLFLMDNFLFYVELRLLNGFVQLLASFFLTIYYVLLQILNQFNAIFKRVLLFLNQFFFISFFLNLRLVVFFLLCIFFLVEIFHLLSELFLRLVLTLP